MIAPVYGGPVCSRMDAVRPGHNEQAARDRMRGARERVGVKSGSDDNAYLCPRQEAFLGILKLLTPLRERRFHA
jgi:hypothetical protein